MRAVLPSISEAEFTRQLVEYAKLHGWSAAHFRPGRTASGGWRTACQFDAKGFPDLVLVRTTPPGVVYAELKVGSNKPTPEQSAWLQRLTLAGERAYLWYPSDWVEIERVLGR